MILKSIRMKNFRPYHGPELIKFAEGEKNITIIQGENKFNECNNLVFI